MADKKVAQLTTITNLSGDDLLLVVNDPSGTPTSNKITVTRVFANVAVNTVHTGLTTFKANTTFTGTKITSTANVAITGDLSVNGYSVLTELDSKITTDAANVLINDRLQVANAAALYVAFGATAEQRVNSNVHFSSSNSTTGVTIANGSIVVRSDNTTPAFIRLYDRAIDSTNTVIAKHTTLYSANSSLVSNNVSVLLPSSNGTLALTSQVDDRLQVANGVSRYGASKQNTLSEIRINAANTTANTGVDIKDGEIVVFTNLIGIPAHIKFYSQAIGANTANTYSTEVIAQQNSELANNVVVTLPASNGTLALSSAVDDRMQVANTVLLVNDRLQVANASATYVSLTTLQTEVAAANSWAEFQARVAAL